MPHQQLRRGSTQANCDSYTPATKEIIVDTTNTCLRLGNSSQTGGFPIHKFAATKTTLDANAVIFANSTTTLNTSTAFTWDGSTLTLDGDITLTGAQTIQTSTGNLTLTTAAGNGNVNINAHGTGDLVVFTNVLYVDQSAANVGIGTASPGAALHVYTTSNPGLIFNSGHADGGYISIQTSGSAIGYIGSAKSNIGGAGMTSSDYGIATSGAGNLYFNAGSTGNIGFGTGNTGTQRVTILNAGNVGIGTTAPSTLLHVGLAGTTLGTIGLAGNTSGLVTLTVAAAAGTWTMKLPTGVAGTAGFQLTDAAGDGITSWASAASTKTAKNVINQFKNTKDALNKMLSASVYSFKYKEGMGTGDLDTEYIGIMAEESPWAMHFNNKILNPVSTFGYTVLSIQALNDEIEKLKKEISQLKKVK